ASAMLASRRAMDCALGLRVLPQVDQGSRWRRELLAALTCDDPNLRDVALTTGARLGLPQAWGVARDLVVAADPAAGQALLLLALRGDPEDHAAIAAAATNEGLRGRALWALGFLGTVEAVELALPFLEDEAHAR